MRQGVSLGREIVRTLVLAMAVCSACSSADSPADVTPTPTTEVATTSPDRGGSEQVLAAWTARAAGRTATYVADIGCICLSAGRYRIVERDGVIVSFEVVEPGRFGFDPRIEPSTLTKALTEAATTAGTANATAAADGTSISLHIDPLPTAADDELTYRAEQITVT